MKKVKPKTEFVKWFGPILDALKYLGGSAKPKEISNIIADNLKLPEKVLNDRYEKSGVLKFQNQLAWARQYLVWEEFIDSSKNGVWTLTNKGWKTKLNEQQAYEIFLKWVKIFQDLRNKKSKVKEEVIIQTIAEEQEQIEPNNPERKIKLIEILQTLSPTGFEHLCGRLLREYDFENIEITQRSHDGGIDGYATLKINPFVSLSVFFSMQKISGNRTN